MNPVQAHTLKDPQPCESSTLNLNTFYTLKPETAVPTQNLPSCHSELFMWSSRFAPRLLVRESAASLDVPGFWA